MERYSSFLYFNLHADGPLAGLLFYHLRDRGIYAQDGFPLFLNAAHSEEDIAQIADAFADSLDEMARGEIIGGVETTSAAAETAADISNGVVPLTESQTEIWLSAQNGDEASCAFNESVTLRLNGPLDLSALRSCDGNDRGAPRRAAGEVQPHGRDDDDLAGHGVFLPDDRSFAGSKPRRTAS